MQVTNYTWDTISDNILEEEAGGDKNLYTSEPELFGSVVSQTKTLGDASSSCFYHSEVMGSTRELTDSNEDVTDTYIDDSWGDSVARTGIGQNPFRWLGTSGYYHDYGSGDYYVRRRQYSTINGQWLSPDPAMFVDGSNLYKAYFVPNQTDPSGQGICSEVFRLFSDWLVAEKKRGLQWLEALPDCPCKLSVIQRPHHSFWCGHYYTTHVLKPYGKEGIWTDPTEASQTFHPGAKWCMRSAGSTPSGHGQQCCYDTMGDLITSGAGAGTPDLVAPILEDGVISTAGDVYDHNIVDVQPYNWAVFLDTQCGHRAYDIHDPTIESFLDFYLRHRPPNQGADPGCEFLMEEDEHSGQEIWWEEGEW